MSGHWLLGLVLGNQRCIAAAALSNTVPAAQVKYKDRHSECELCMGMWTGIAAAAGSNAGMNYGEGFVNSAIMFAGECAFVWHGDWADAYYVVARAANLNHP